MRKTNQLTLLVLAGAAAIHPLRANSILNLYTERVRPVYDAAGGPSIGYYNSSDPTLTYRNHTVSDSWTHGGHEDVKVSDTAHYASPNSVNRDKVHSVCGTGFCASDPWAEGHSSATSSGHANTQTLSLGGYTGAHNNGAAIGALADTDASVTAMFRVTSGDSGLADGSLVDLNWLYHLEGSSHVAGRTYPDMTDAITDVYSSALIRSLYGTGEGYNILASVDFNLGLHLTDEILSGGSDDTAYLTGEQSWSAYSNTGFTKDAYESYSRGYSGTSNDISRSVHVDSKTGIFELDYVPFQAVVGEWMVIEFDMHLFSAVSGGADPFGPMEYGSAYNDYFNTLKNGFAFGGASQGLGLQLEFEALDPVATPEPGTTLFAGFGLTAIGWLWRRRLAS